MNRIILIGNGFDLAHDLPTSYRNFINHYWEQWGVKLKTCESVTEQRDRLCRISQKGEYQPWSSIFAKADDLIGDENSAKAVIEVVKTHHDRFLIEATPFFQHINQSFETKNWVDIESEYYFG